MSGSVPSEQHRLWAVFLRGMAMGAADIIPGVSGGTIAFITGIYFRLLEAVGRLPNAAFTYLLKGKWKDFWRESDASFLLCLLLGILTSIATLASLITLLLTNFPILIWSFFFGLILASVWHVGRQIKSLRSGLLAPFLVGVVFAWWVTTLTGAPQQPSSLIFLGAGALAICAMILPGISGSFILVILGMYAPVLAAIKGPELATLAVFAVGCLIGLLSVARIITWAFRHFHDAVLGLLIGFMVGALNKIWPWKETLTWRVNSSGERVPLNEASVSPFSYAELTGQEPQLLLASVCAIVGFALVLVVEKIGQRASR